MSIKSPAVDARLHLQVLLDELLEENIHLNDVTLNLKCSNVATSQYPWVQNDILSMNSGLQGVV